MNLRGSERKIKAWKDVWSAGQEVGSVDAIEPVAEIVEKLLDGYRRACKA